MSLNKKRKHKTLTLKEKCEILQSLDEGKTIKQVAEKFHIAEMDISEELVSNADF